MEQLRTHVPDLNSTGGKMRLGLYILGWFTLVTIYFIFTDRIPTWSIDSEILILAMGFLTLSLFFSRKKLYQQKYGELAFRNAFTKFVIPGLALIFNAIAHAAYMNGPFFPRGWWTNIFHGLGWLMVIVGAALWLRAIFAFGVDNLTMLYVYYPGESKLSDASIYNILRHPIYAGALRVMIGLALLNGNANSILFIPFAPLLFFGWIRLVEEKNSSNASGNPISIIANASPPFGRASSHSALFSNS
jgi:protein-S-isoprenylcysteine O-methyltransferase Ste14